MALSFSKPGGRGRIFFLRRRSRAHALRRFWSESIAVDRIQDSLGKILRVGGCEDATEYDDTGGQVEYEFVRHDNLPPQTEILKQRG
jgi:hypothetical protein